MEGFRVYRVLPGAIRAPSSLHGCPSMWGGGISSGSLSDARCRESRGDFVGNAFPDLRLRLAGSVQEAADRVALWMDAGPSSSRSSLEEANPKTYFPNKPGKQKVKLLDYY